MIPIERFALNYIEMAHNDEITILDNCENVNYYKKLKNKRIK